MKTDITTTATNPLLHLLQVFSAESLGEGDLVAGANVLAAKSISLANLYPPGSCLIAPDGNRLPVGMSFASVGGLTDSLVSEKVLDPIASIQNNLGDHLAAAAAHNAAKLAAMPPQDRLRNRPSVPANSSALANLDLARNGMLLERDSSAFRQLLAPCRDRGLGELVTTPTVFLNAVSPAGLERQLSQAHRRHPYIRAVLADGPGARLESMLLSVVRGTGLSAKTSGPVHIRGHLAASCTTAKLAQAIEAGEERLLAKLLWLVDGKGSAMSSEQGAGASSAQYATHLNYPRALQSAWAKRLDCLILALRFLHSSPQKAK
jgi:hypothetical protein